MYYIHAFHFFLIKFAHAFSFHTLGHQGPAVWQKCSIVAFLLWWSLLAVVALNCNAGFLRLLCWQAGEREIPPHHERKKGFRCFQTTSGPALFLVPRHHLISCLCCKNIEAICSGAQFIAWFETCLKPLQSCFKPCNMKLAKLKSSSSSSLNTTQNLQNPFETSNIVFQYSMGLGFRV